MLRVHRPFLVGGWLLLVAVTPLLAQPAFVIDDFQYFYGDPISVWLAPNASGTPLHSAMVYGGALENASVRLHFWDPVEQRDIEGFPAEDCWLLFDSGPHGTVTSCAGGPFYADGPSDWYGWMVFSEPLAGGGWSQAGATVYVLGAPAADEYGNPYPIVPLSVNSPDISGDLAIGLTDIALFVHDMHHNNYNYRSDFYYDGFINLSDVVVMASCIGVVCD